nr:unnamed protein product [Callosobruchus analis]
MSHEIQCLNREKQLLIALNDEMKSRNMLLEEKIASSQTYAAKTARPAQGESSSLASGLQVKHSNRILPSAGVVVKTMNASISSNEIFSDIQRNVDLNSLKLGLGGVKHIRNGVIIRCENNEAVEKLKVCVHSKLGSKYSVDKMKRFNPRIIVRKTIIANNWSDADIVANICVLNKLASHDTSNIKIVTKFKFQNSIDIVLEVSPSLRSFFIAQGFMYVGYNKCYLADHIRIIRCHKCSGIGHSEKNCTGSIVCPLCSGGHRMKECLSQNLKCCNCSLSNEKHKTKLDVNHSSISINECTVLQNTFRNLKAKIDYGEE